jgi:hypothetical protein
MAHLVLADDIGPGGTAFFIVLALIGAALVIFWAMFGSLRRLKKSVASGDFGTQHEARDEPVGAESPAEPAATPDQGGRGGAGA